MRVDDLDQRRSSAGTAVLSCPIELQRHAAFAQYGATMSSSHAVIWMDHECARILRVDLDHEDNLAFRLHPHYTRQHGSRARTEHEFFALVCDGVAGIREVLMTGSGQVLADFRHYVEKHRPRLAPRISGWKVVDHPSDGQLVALAKSFFAGQDRMKATTAIC